MLLSTQELHQTNESTRLFINTARLSDVNCSFPLL